MAQDLQHVPRLIATSVVRGSEQGESHGGVYLVDFARRKVTQAIDWNTTRIDFAGRGWDRGLRGIAFFDDLVCIAASDELYFYDSAFRLQRSFRNPFLKHCHEICRGDELLFLTSTGYDSVLVFDLARGRFIRGLHLSREADAWRGQPFDPCSETGPPFVNALHLNSVYAGNDGIYLSGLRTHALLRIDGQSRIHEICSLPAGAHNARPFRDGVLFNDTGADCVRFAGRDGAERAFRIRVYDPDKLQNTELDDSRVARQAFGRGLCIIDGGLIAAGSSPSTITLYDLDANRGIASVNLSMDIRNAIHGLEVWPFSGDRAGS